MSGVDIFRIIAIYLLKMAGAVVAGLCVAAFLVLLLLKVSEAAPQEGGVTTVRQAEPLQGDRGFNYRSQPNTTTKVVYMVDVPNVSIRYCESWNRDLFVKVQYIASRIARDPSIGYIYGDTLVTIHKLWCVT